MIKLSAAAARMFTVGALIAFAASAAQHDYPNKPVRLVKAGKVKGIAITGNTCSPLLPNVPTFDEAGLANFYNHKRAPFGIVAPARTPKPIIDKLSTEVAKYVRQPAFRNVLVGLGLEPYQATPSEYADVLKAGMAWNINTINVLKKKGVRFDI